MGAVLTATAAIAALACPPDVTQLECRLGKKVLLQKVEIEELKASRDNAKILLSNCDLAIEMAGEHGCPPTEPIESEDTLSKPAIAGVATAAVILGAVLTVVAVYGGDNGKVVAASIGGTAIAAGWTFTILIW